MYDCMEGDRRLLFEAMVLPLSELTAQAGRKPGRSCAYSPKVWLRFFPSAECSFVLFLRMTCENVFPSSATGPQNGLSHTTKRASSSCCAHCHGQDADGGEDTSSLLKLQISGAHMALVIQSGIKDEVTPVFGVSIRGAPYRSNRNNAGI